MGNISLSAIQSINLAVLTLAEQVEAQADFDALREMGVDFIQGNYVDRPHPIGESAAASVAVH